MSFWRTVRLWTDHKLTNQICRFQQTNSTDDVSQAKGDADQKSKKVYFPQTFQD